MDSAGIRIKRARNYDKENIRLQKNLLKSTSMSRLQNVLVENNTDRLQRQEKSLEKKVMRSQNKEEEIKELKSISNKIESYNRQQQNLLKKFQNDSQNGKEIQIGFQDQKEEEFFINEQAILNKQLCDLYAEGQ